MRTPPEQWKATPVSSLTATDIVLFDTGVVSHVYSKHVRGERADPWLRFCFDPALDSPRRIVNDIVRWELGRSNRAREWMAWMARHFVRAPMPA